MSVLSLIGISSKADKKFAYYRKTTFSTMSQEYVSRVRGGSFVTTCTLNKRKGLHNNVNFQNKDWQAQKMFSLDLFHRSNRKANGAL